MRYRGFFMLRLMLATVWRNVMPEYIVTCKDNDGEELPLSAVNKDTLQLNTIVFKSYREAGKVIAEELIEQENYYKKGLLQPSEMNDVTDFNITLLQ